MEHIEFTSSVFVDTSIYHVLQEVINYVNSYSTEKFSIQKYKYITINSENDLTYLKWFSLTLLKQLDVLPIDPIDNLSGNILKDIAVLNMLKRLIEDTRSIFHVLEKHYTFYEEKQPKELLKYIRQLSTK